MERILRLKAAQSGAETPEPDLTAIRSKGSEDGQHRITGILATRSANILELATAHREANAMCSDAVKRLAEAEKVAKQEAAYLFPRALFAALESMPGAIDATDEAISAYAAGVFSADPAGAEDYAGHIRRHLGRHRQLMRAVLERTGWFAAETRCREADASSDALLEQLMSARARNAAEVLVKLDAWYCCDEWEHIQTQAADGDFKAMTMVSIRHDLEQLSLPSDQGPGCKRTVM